MSAEHNVLSPSSAELSMGVSGQCALGMPNRMPDGRLPPMPSYLTDSIRFLSFVTHGVVVFSAVISGISLER